MEDAHEAYKKAALYAEKYLGTQNSLTKNMKEIVAKIKTNIEKENLKKMERENLNIKKLIRIRSNLHTAGYIVISFNLL